MPFVYQHEKFRLQKIEKNLVPLGSTVPHVSSFSALHLLVWVSQYVRYNLIVYIGKGNFRDSQTWGSILPSRFKVAGWLIRGRGARAVGSTRHDILWPQRFSPPSNSLTIDAVLKVCNRAQKRILEQWDFTYLRTYIYLVAMAFATLLLSRRPRILERRCCAPPPWWICQGASFPWSNSWKGRAAAFCYFVFWHWIGYAFSSWAPRLLIVLRRTWFKCPKLSIADEGRFIWDNKV